MASHRKLSCGSEGWFTGETLMPRPAPPCRACASFHQNRVKGFKETQTYQTTTFYCKVLRPIPEDQILSSSEVPGHEACDWVEATTN
jgi:hypothetical protein